MKFLSDIPLLPLAESLLVSGENEPVTNIVLRQSLKGFLKATLADLNFLNPTLDCVLAGKVKHGKHLRTVTDVGSANGGTVRSELLSHHLRHRLVTEANSVELAPNLEDAEVLVHVELVHGVGSVDDEVERELVSISPALLLGADETVCTHLHGIVLLVGAVGDGVGLSTHGFGEQETKVTQTTNADDTDLLAGAGTQSGERRIDGQTSTEHRRGNRGLEAIRNLECEVFVGSDVGSVTTLRDGSVWVRCTVGVNGARAVVLLVSLAVVASQISLDLCTNTDCSFVSTASRFLS